jgi:GNAT superfamily N-acetyltransferase
MSTTQVRIERLDVADLDLDTAARLASIDNAALAGVPLRRHSAETFRIECRYRGDDGPYDGLWLARTDEGLVGYAALVLNRFEYLDGAKILGAVHPVHQRRGVGRALLETVEATTDRPKLRAPAWADTPGELAVPRFGYSRTGSHEVRQVSVRAPQPPELVAAAEEASRDYDLERYVGPCPEDLLGDMQVLREAINDAPDPGGEFEHYPPERIRSYEASLANRHETLYTVVARHRRSGDPAGLSMVCVLDLRPQIAAQEDTSVLAPHRGRRLGLRMKLAMLDWLRAVRPDVELSQTWNVPENAPMIAINDALGCTVVAETIAFRKER